MSDDKELKVELVKEQEDNNYPMQCPTDEQRRAWLFENISGVEFPFTGETLRFLSEVEEWLKTGKQPADKKPKKAELKAVPKE